MKGAGERAPARTIRQQVWSESAACAEAARRGREQAAIHRETAPKCGARRKEDGKPCEGLALENGRCRIHGGLTPSGSAWHKPRYPAAGAPLAKLEKKLRELEGRERRRRARVAAMSATDREIYFKRREACRPRSVTERAAERQQREAAEILGSPRVSAPESPEIALLRARLAALDLEQAQLEAALVGQDGGAETEYRESR